MLFICLLSFSRRLMVQETLPSPSMGGLRFYHHGSVLVRTSQGAAQNHRQLVIYFGREAVKFTNSMIPICDLKEKEKAQQH